MTDNASAGATPVVAGATPAQTPPPNGTPSAAPPPATGDPDALGDAGKRALEAMKAERDAASRDAKAAKQALEALQDKSATDAEKAIKAARAEGLAQGHAQIRRSEVKAALAGAGINASVLDLALGAPDFAALKVNDEGEVEGLGEAIAAFKKARADLFKPTAAPGSADGGAHGSPSLGTNMNDLIRAAARG